MWMPARTRRLPLPARSTMPPWRRILPTSAIWAAPRCSSITTSGSAGPGMFSIQVTVLFFTQWVVACRGQESAWSVCQPAIEADPDFAALCQQVLFDLGPYVVILNDGFDMTAIDHVFQVRRLGGGPLQPLRAQPR